MSTAGASLTEKFEKWSVIYFAKKASFSAIGLRKRLGSACMSSKALYWLIFLPRLKSFRNNFKGSNPNFNFKKPFTIKKKKPTDLTKDTACNYNSTKTFKKSNWKLKKSSTFKYSPYKLETPICYLWVICRFLYFVNVCSDKLISIIPSKSRKQQNCQLENRVQVQMNLKTLRSQMAVSLCLVNLSKLGT